MDLKLYFSVLHQLQVRRNIIDICVLNAENGVFPLEREKLMRDTIVESANYLETGNTPLRKQSAIAYFGGIFPSETY